MKGAAVFFNNRIVSENFKLADYPAAIGDWCLRPVRYLFNGNAVYMSGELPNCELIHLRDQGPKKTWKTIVSIILLVPGVILGSAFKALGFVFLSVREKHKLTVVHYTPVNYTIGSPEKRWTHDAIQSRLQQIKAQKPAQEITNIIIYARPNTQIIEDPGILALNPQKIIFDGAHICHGPSRQRLSDMLWNDHTWERDHYEDKDPRFYSCTNGGGSRALQWKTKSVADALNDVLPRTSWYSLEPLKRVYVVVS